MTFKSWKHKNRIWKCEVKGVAARAGEECGRAGKDVRCDQPHTIPPLPTRRVPTNWFDGKWYVHCRFPHTLAHNSFSSLSSASRLLGTPGLLAYHRCSCIRLVWQRGRPRRGTRHSPIIETHPTGVDGAAAQGLGPAFLFPYLVSIGESEKSNAPVRCALVSGHRPHNLRRREDRWRQHTRHGNNLLST